MEFRKSFSKEIHFQKKSIPWKLKDLKNLKIRLSLLFQIRSGIPQHQRSKRDFRVIAGSAIVSRLTE